METKEMMETKERKTIKEKMRLKAIFLMSVISLLVLCLMWSCEGKNDPLEGGVTGQGQARVMFNIDGMGYDDGAPSLLSGGVEEKQTVLVPLGDGENLLECTLERVAETAQTRSTSMAAGTKVKVFVFDMDNDKLVASGVILSGDTDEGIVLDAGKRYIVRAVSYNSTTDAPEYEVTLGTNLSTAGFQVTPTRDLLYSTGCTTPVLQAGNNTVDLHFKHVFSKVTVVADASYYSQNINACSATLTPGGGSSSINLNSGTLTTPMSTGKNITWLNLGSQVVTSEPAVVNTSGESNLTLNFTSITVGSSTYNNKSVAFNESIDPGYCYTLMVNFRNIPSVTIDGVTWAKANLYKTETTQGLFSKEYEYGGNIMESGGYWSWGATQPWSDYKSYYKNGAVGGQNAADWSEQNYVNDPCRLILGEPWRLPTNSEFSSLIDPNMSPRRFVAGYYSADGADGSTVYGKWLGTNQLSDAEDDPDAFIFLPTAGGRGFNDTKIYQFGRYGYGYYWVSQPSNPGNNVYYLSFGDNNGGVTYSSYSEDYGFGRSIRCVCIRN